MCMEAYVYGGHHSFGTNLSTNTLATNIHCTNHWIDYTITTYPVENEELTFAGGDGKGKVDGVDAIGIFMCDRGSWFGYRRQNWSQREASRQSPASFEFVCLG